MLLKIIAGRVDRQVADSNGALAMTHSGIDAVPQPQAQIDAAVQVGLHCLAGLCIPHRIVTYELS